MDVFTCMVPSIFFCTIFDGLKKGHTTLLYYTRKPSTRPSISDMRDLTNCSDHLHSTFGLFVLKNKPCLYKRSACRLSSEKGGVPEKRMKRMTQRVFSRFSAFFFRAGLQYKGNCSTGSVSLGASSKMQA